MTKAVAAGALYFSIVFAAGFCLGAMRVTFLAPAVGETLATLLELPVILSVSWAACLVVLQRMNVDGRAAGRLVMGAVAFVLLLAAEIGLGLGLMNRSFPAQIEEMTAPSGLIGLAGQALFAFFPVIALSVRQDA